MTAVKAAALLTNELHMLDAAIKRSGESWDDVELAVALATVLLEGESQGRISSSVAVAVAVCVAVAVVPSLDEFCSLNASV